MEKLGEKIRRLRKEADKYQKELLDNQSAVAQIENGSNLNPKRARIKEIAINLGTTIEELVKDTDWKETNGPVVLATAITSKYRPNIVNPKIFLIIVFYFIASSKKHPKIIHQIKISSLVILFVGISIKFTLGIINTT